MGGSSVSSGSIPFKFSIDTLLQSIIFGCCNLNADEDKEVTFIRQRICETSQWLPYTGKHRILKIEDKRHCTTTNLDETQMNYSLVNYYHFKVQLSDDAYKVWR